MRLALTLCLLPTLAAADPVPVAVFDFSFLNFSQEVEYGERNAAEHARARLITDALRDQLAASGRYTVVDNGPAAADLALHGNPFTCNQCEAKIAAKLGAERSFTGQVQKISTLIQTVILRERDAETGEIVAQYQTDIRNNTDEAWLRGISWLVEHRVMVQAEP